jgi:hypothetical protein
LDVDDEQFLLYLSNYKSRLEWGRSGTLRPVFAGGEGIRGRLVGETVECERRGAWKWTSAWEVPLDRKSS